MALADRANDTGDAWPSISTLSSDTCFGRTAVIDAIEWLEDAHAIRANRSNGRHTTYALTPADFVPNQSAKRTGTPPGPVRLPDTTSPADGRDQSASRTGPVRQADTNPKEPKGTHKSNPKGTVVPLPSRKPLQLPEWLSPTLWADWDRHRKQLKRGAGWTPVAQERAQRDLAELRERGFSPEDVIENAIRNGWRGLYEPSSKSYATRRESLAERAERLQREGDVRELRRHGLDVTAPVTGKHFEGSSNEDLDAFVQSLAS